MPRARVRAAVPRDRCRCRARGRHRARTAGGRAQAGKDRAHGGHQGNLRRAQGKDGWPVSLLVQVPTRRRARLVRAWQRLAPLPPIRSQPRARAHRTLPPGERPAAYTAPQRRLVGRGGRSDARQCAARQGAAQCLIWGLGT